RFEDYPARGKWKRKDLAVTLDTQFHRWYRTRLRAAGTQPANFAGHYSLVDWGCGTECAYGAVVDLNSGRATFLPSIICCRRGEIYDSQPMGFSMESRLLVLSGWDGTDRPMGEHYYEIAGGKFRYIGTFPVAVDSHEENQEQ